MSDDNTKIIEGRCVKTGADCLIIGYDEDLWYAFDEEQQENCKRTWIKKYEPVAEYGEIALQLQPDIMFPMHGKEKPYIAWRHKFERSKPKDFDHVACLTITLRNRRYAELEVPERNEIRALIDSYPEGTKYEIFHGHSLEQRGTVGR